MMNVLFLGIVLFLIVLAIFDLVAVNIESTIVYLNLIQESEQIISGLRHILRGITKFCAFRQANKTDAKLLQFD